MEIVAFILFIVAAVLFAVAARPVPTRWNLIPVGLCVLTVGFIVQFCSQTRQVHF